MMTVCLFVYHKLFSCIAMNFIKKEVSQMILIPILLVVAFIYLFNGDNKISISNQHNDPERKLKERYINGEIDEETYLRMKSVLNGKS